MSEDKKIGAKFKEFLAKEAKTENGVTKYYFTHRGFSDYLRNQKITFDYTMLREILKSFGAIEDTLRYFDALDEEHNFPCWSKVEDKNIEEEYEGAMEIEQGDKAGFSVESVSEASNTDVKETHEEDKPYTDEDKADAENLF